MTLTLDASVWIASAYPAEPDYHSSSELIRELLRFGEELASTNLVLVEVSAAAARKTRMTLEGLRMAHRVESFPWHRWYPLGAAIANSARVLAAQLYVRGADAMYAAVATVSQSTLVTLDQELLVRASSAVTVSTPSEWLRQHAV